ncbi:MAG: HEAT repeat domain-containing protein [Cyanobacteria bacterium J06632_22]
MSPGLALLVGILIGAAVVYFLMQARLQERTSVSNNSQERAASLSATYERDLEQRLADQRSQLEADYEQRITAKLEQYQGEHAQQMAELEGEYQARLAVLEGSDVNTGRTSAEQGTDTTTESAIAASEPPSTVAETDRPVRNAAAAAAVLGVAAGAVVLPDPWEEQPVSPSQPATSQNIATDTADISIAPPLVAESAPPPTQITTIETALPADTVTQLDNPLPEYRQAAAQSLGKAAATSRKETALALPMLGKLSKDPDPAVRLAAVQALQTSGTAKAVPLLKQSLRDPDSDVVAAASAALNRFKGLSRPKPKKAKKKRPKNR